MEPLKIPTDVVPSDKVPITNPDGVRPVYSNNVGAAFTSTDLRIFFNEIGTIPDGLGAKAVQEIRAVVTLPLSMIDGLINTLEQVKEQVQKGNKTSEADASGQQ